MGMPRLTLAIFCGLHSARQVHHGLDHGIQLLANIILDRVGHFFGNPQVLAQQNSDGGLLVVSAFLVLLAGVTIIAAPLVFFAFDLLGTLVPNR